jgi:glucokinase
MIQPPDPTGVTIGIDIGGTNVRAARVDAQGRMAGHVKVRTGSGTNVTDLIHDLAQRLLDDDVVAVGIGIPGRLDRDGTSILSAGYVDLAGLRLGELISVSIGRPVILDNDAHMALVAELATGAAIDAEHVVMFTVGTGIGGAVAMSGTVLRGRGNAGQLGHLTLDPDGPACNCGRRGCSEVLASGTALTGYIREAGLPAGMTAEQLLERHERDPVAAGILRRWAGAWRGAIDTAVAVLDPDLVVLGGGLGNAAAAALRIYSPTTSPWFQCPVAAARLGDDAGVIGAGLRAFAL